MHVGGRLKLAASLPFLQKHQIILPHSNHVTNLIIKDIHTKLGHAGRQHVLAEIRKKFWLIRANATIRKILNSCVACHKRSNISCTQQMADLPPRIVEVYPDPSGFVRTVKLQTKQSYITRPITKLTLLHAAES